MKRIRKEAQEDAKKENTATDEYGGGVATYQVQVYHPDKGEWQTVELCFDTLTVLTDQERGVDLMYRVVTLNKTGEGLESNTVTVVL